MLAAWNPWPGASSSANPPPMQNPITPILPVQRSWPASQARTASISSKVRPCPLAASRIIVRRQVSLLPQANRSGATARWPWLASQSAWRCKSWLIPEKSWITTTPGHGPAPDGVAR
jgi:hypothetical protein